MWKMEHGINPLYESCMNITHFTEILLVAVEKCEELAGDGGKSGSKFC